MSMTFFYLLKDNGYDWTKAKDIFYNLTDVQLAWINGTVSLEDKKNEKNREEAEREAKRSNRFGEVKNKRSFDLRS